MKRFLLLITGLIVTFNFIIAKEINTPYYNWQLKEGKGKQEFEQYCLMCHSPGYVFNIAQGKNKSPHLWEHIVHQMVNDFKAPIPKEAQEKIIEYLNTYYK
jgi:mono/diheme cytochrome c family protein